MSRHAPGWLMPVSALAALLLGLLPLPVWMQPYRPYWLARVVVYWLIEAPDRFGLGFAFLAGVLADLCFGTVLGEQALRLTVMAFIVQRFRAQLRFFPLSQQALALAGRLLNDSVGVMVLHHAQGAPPPPPPAGGGP
ncbi:MAG: rod shape-determining protein MreD, partial [Luteimonas sp.]